MTWMELDSTRAELREARRAGTVNAVTVALLESRLEECISRREAAEGRVNKLKAAHANEIKEVMSRVRVETNGQYLAIRAG